MSTNSSRRTSVQSRLASKAPPTVSVPSAEPATPDPILANIVARLKAQARQTASGGRGDSS